MIRFPAVLLPIFLFFAPSAHAQFELAFGGGEDKGPASKASMVAESTTIQPGGTVTLALELRHPDGWHSYYKNSGGVELPPSIEWRLPEGFTVGKIQWPAPEVKEGYSGKSFIYSGSPVFLIDLTAPASAKPGESVSIGAKASWQICENSCIDENATFSLTLAISETSSPDADKADFFKNARAAIPVESKAWSAQAVSEGQGDIHLRLTPPDGMSQPVEGLDFIPNEPFVEALSAGGDVKRDGAEWLVTLKRKTKDFIERPIPQGETVSGILVAPDVLDPASGAKSVIIGETRIASPPPAPLPLSKYFSVLGGMLLGGLILNLMPCVFPVIGLKIMGFVQQAGADRTKIAVHGVAFTVGVLASFGVLSGILFAAREAAARSGGRDIGWGYQLENPWIVLTLMLLMFVLALNMFGLFELGTSATSVGGKLQSKQGLSGSFFSGVLATVVATPCSAPFLGVAIGAAIALPAGQFFTAFGSMALGLALPYLVLSIFPDLVRALPRPGPWMESFKQGMSFLLFATAGFLLWVYAGQIGLANLLSVIFGLSLIALAAWVYGRWNLPHRSRDTRLAGVVIAILFAVCGFLLAKPPKPVDAEHKLVWEAWSQEKTDQLLEEGHPVFIDFTAQWCLTCQVNKKRAYTPEVVALMKERGIVPLIADKTNTNPEIDAKLRELGRSAIPVNVLLVPDKEPIITPELLSSSYLLELFEKEVPSPEEQDR